MRIIKIVILIIATTVSVYAQEVSVLPQYLAMNPLIKRDPQFVQLQYQLEHGELMTQTGLNLGVGEKMESLRRIVNKLDLTFSVTDDDSVRMNFKFYDQLIERKALFKLGDKLDSCIRSIQNNVELAFTQSIDEEYSLLNGELPNQYRADLFLFFLVTSTLDRKEIDYSSFQSLTYKEIRTNFEDAIKNVFIKGLISGFQNSNEEQINKLNMRLNDLIQLFKSKAVEYSYLIEKKLQEYENDINDQAWAGNAGFGVSQEEGNLGGGIYASVHSNKNKNGQRNFQLGAFVSGVGEIGKSSDSINSLISQPFVAGANLKIVTKNMVQINIIGAYRRNSESINDKKSFSEVGFGLMKRLKNGLIIGASGYYLDIDETISQENELGEIVSTTIPSVYTFGLTFQDDSANSPVIMIGVTKSNLKGEPLIPNLQLSYPINFSQK